MLFRSTVLIEPLAPPELRAEMTRRLGLDRPLWQQYLTYIRDLSTGDLGRSFLYQRPVTEVLGEKAYARLEDILEKIDVVDIFRRSEFVMPLVESAIRIRAKAVWMQEGVIDEGAAQRARAAGLLVVMDRCMLKEHRLWKEVRREK